jgi:hypothetical protein
VTHEVRAPCTTGDVISITYPLELSGFASLSLDNINQFKICSNEDFFGYQIRPRTITSTRKKINLNFLLGNYLKFTFSLNKQFPSHIVTKYFKRLRQLLSAKIDAINSRLESRNNTSRQTITFINFLTRIT